MPESGQVIVNRWNAEFQYIQTPYGLVVNSLTLQAGRTEIEPEPFELSLDNPATWSAVVVEDAVQMFVENQIPDGIKEIRIRISPKHIHVTAKVKVLVEIEAVADCLVRIKNGKQLFVEVESVSVGGSAVRNLVQQQLDKVNPILDAKDLPLNLSFETVVLEDQRIVISGYAEP